MYVSIGRMSASNDSLLFQMTEDFRDRSLSNTSPVPNFSESGTIVVLWKPGFLVLDAIFSDRVRNKCVDEYIKKITIRKNNSWMTTYATERREKRFP